MTHFTRFKLLTLSCSIALSAIAFSTKANALTFSFDNTSDTATGEFKYDLELAEGESIRQAGDSISGLADVLTLSNFTGMASGTNPYTLDSSGASSANFSVNTTTTGAIGGTTLDDVITINAPGATLGTINYDLTFSGGFPGGTIQGPVTPVPFEPEANLSIFILLGLAGFRHYCKKQLCRKKLQFLVPHSQKTASQQG